MMPDLVSIVIVCHNNWPDLELAIQSALHQSYRPVEVIVVDNSSTDATADEVSRRFGGEVQYTRQPNVGDGGGYNTGMRAAQGEFVQFLDGDDFLAANKIEKQMETFRSDSSADIVYGDMRYFQSLPGIVQDWKDEDLRDYEDMLAVLVSPRSAYLSTEAMLYRRRALERVGDYGASLYVVDCDYWLRAAWAGCRFRYCPGSLAFHRIRPGQMSSDQTAMLLGYEAVWSKALRYITREPYRTAIRAHLARVQFVLSLGPYGLTTREALQKLSKARAISSETIHALAYALASTVILLPGGRRLLRQQWIRSLRRWVARRTLKAQ